MSRRHEIPDDHWDRIKDLPPPSQPWDEFRTIWIYWASRPSCRHASHNPRSGVPCATKSTDVGCPSGRH